MNLKIIHIGTLVKSKVEELSIPLGRIAKFMHCNEEQVEDMYLQNSMDTEVLLRWSKLLEFDFFRIYSGHLILYAPPTMTDRTIKVEKSTMVFRKSIYTQEVKSFILDKIKSGQMSTVEVVSKYKIPKTTLYKWIKK
ncbi:MULTISPECIES: transposase [Chryseobacterium]|uniref:transposase n=1 Tax=Chryseobacterium TaxID=59732 RepID=UPI001297037C|nr:MULTISPECIES: transposase [Chryseobacterium]MDR6922978.1 hypothetical protein [Chryseobacterium sp. 2987]